ncbi:MAG: hypothetical protein ACOZBL_03380 [Patescibacteria group bacterium]
MNHEIGNNAESQGVYDQIVGAIISSMFTEPGVHFAFAQPSNQTLDNAVYQHADDVQSQHQSFLSIDSGGLSVPFGHGFADALSIVITQFIKTRSFCQAGFKFKVQSIKSGDIFNKLDAIADLVIK